MADTKPKKAPNSNGHFNNLPDKNDKGMYVLSIVNLNCNFLMSVICINTRKRLYLYLGNGNIKPLSCETYSTATAIYFILH